MHILLKGLILRLFMRKWVKLDSVGMGIYLFSVSNAILLQTHVDKSLIGRINTFKVIINNGSIMAFIPLVTLISTKISYQYTFAIGGIITLTISIIGLTWAITAEKKSNTQTETI